MLKTIASSSTLPITLVLLQVLLSGCANPQPSPTPPISAQTPQPDEGVELLVRDPVPIGSYVVLRGGTLKHPTAAGARADKTRGDAPTLYVHKVEQDLGDVVLVRPVSPDATESESHCYLGSYLGANRALVSAFVAKANLQPVLTKPMSWGEDGDQVQLRPGLGVSTSQGRWVAHGVAIDIELPTPPLSGLSYTPEGSSFPFTNPTEMLFSGPRPTLPFLEYETTLTVAGQALETQPGWRRHLDKEFSNHINNERHTDAFFNVQAQQPGASVEDPIQVRVAESCLQVDGTVPGDGVSGSPPGVGGVGGLDIPITGLASLGEGRLAAANTPIRWTDGNPAGVLTNPLEMKASPDPICFDPDQDVKGEVCVAAGQVARDCREACTKQGRCQASPDNTSCVAVSTDDCKKSDACWKEGLCEAKAGACVGTAASCKDSDACSTLGHCSLVDDRCAATTRAECKASTACSRWGACTPKDGTCQRKVPCSKSKMCREEGKCDAKKGTGECVATSDAHCAASKACRERGDCALGDYGDCGAETAAHCKASKGCKVSGKCALQGSRCFFGTDADCRASSRCRVEGLCKRMEEEVEDAFGGAGSFGGSSPQKRVYCGATKKSCKASFNCKKHGYCTAKRGYGQKVPEEKEPEPSGIGAAGIAGTLGSGPMKSMFGAGPAHADEGWYCEP